jgi:hypothetical protein
MDNKARYVSIKKRASAINNLWRVARHREAESAMQIAGREFAASALTEQPAVLTPRQSPVYDGYETITGADILRRATHFDCFMQAALISLIVEVSV